MPTRDEWLRQPLRERLDRMARTPDDLASAIRGLSDTVLSHRPDAEGWSAKEVICHLRDIEELSILRFHTMLAMNDPKVFVVGAIPADPTQRGIGGDVPFPLVDFADWTVGIAAHDDNHVDQLKRPLPKT